MAIKTSKKYILIGIIFAIIAAFGFILLAIVNSDRHFRLSDEYYGTSESIDLDKDQYENLIAQKKSFIVIIDKPCCTTTQAMREQMASFPEDMQFKYYNMMWSEVRSSSLHEHVKFTPSVAIIKEGTGLVWLQSDRDEDSEYFNNADALRDWIKSYVSF